MSPMLLLYLDDYLPVKICQLANKFTGSIAGFRRLQELLPLQSLITQTRILMKSSHGQTNLVSVALRLLDLL